MVTTHVFVDADNTEYLVTLFSNGKVTFAIRESGRNTWSPPLPSREVSK